MGDAAEPEAGVDDAARRPDVGGGLIACVDELDCLAHESCSDAGVCEEGEVPGCREDRTEPADDVAEGATPLVLGILDRDGFRVGAAEGVLCGEDHDFYAVQVPAGGRLRVRLSFDVDENLDLALSGGDLQNPIEIATLEVPEEVVHPSSGRLQDAAVFFIDVHGTGRAQGTTYRVEVTVAVEAPECFPDALDELGDDRYQDATPVRAARYEQPHLSFCPGRDEDWLTLRMNMNDGLRIEAVTWANEPPIVIELYSRGRIEGAGGGPEHEGPMAEPRGDQIAYVLERPAGAFNNQDWFIRIRSSDPTAYSDYSLTVIHVWANPCPDDGHEPNDGVMAGTDLEALVGVNGEVPYDDVGLEVSGEAGAPLFICAFDDDYFCLDLEENDALEAWAVGDGVVGDVEVHIVDDRGQVFGAAGFLTAPGAPLLPAQVVGVPAGRYCVVVDGQAAAQGAYHLFVRRFEPPDLCEMPDNNPTAAGAAPLIDVGEVEPDRRFTSGPAALCGGELDWYSFPVREARSRVCVTTDRFRNDLNDLQLELFRDVAGDDPDLGCMNSAQCEAGAECVRGFCQIPTATGAAMIDLDKRDLGPAFGPWLVKVSGHAAPAFGLAYHLTTTVVPEDARCPEDWQERDHPNNTDLNPTPLGAGPVALCDAWICEGEGSDWYQATVPAGEDRTVFITFNSQEDGRLFLDYQGPSPDPNNVFDGFRRSADPMGNTQCINIRGGAEAHDVLLRVFDNLIRPDGDTRVDYSLRIVPTDLDAGLVGECVRLGGAALPPCPVHGPFEGGCWPWAELP